MVDVLFLCACACVCVQIIFYSIFFKRLSNPTRQFQRYIPPLCFSIFNFYLRNRAWQFENEEKNTFLRGLRIPVTLRNILLRVSFAKGMLLLVLHLPKSILPPLYSHTIRWVINANENESSTAFGTKAAARRAFALCEWHFPFSAKVFIPCLIPEAPANRSRATRIDNPFMLPRRCIDPILKWVPENLWLSLSSEHFFSLVDETFYFFI